MSRPHPVPWSFGPFRVYGAGCGSGPVADPVPGAPASPAEPAGEDMHVHYVTLPDGSEAVTGPPVHAEGEMMGGEAAAGGMMPMAGGAAPGMTPMAPGALRAPLAPGAVLEAAIRLKAEKEEAGQHATFDQCVEAVMAKPGFEPQGDRTPEESAAAICATKPGGPQEGKTAGAKVRSFALPDPDKDVAKALMGARSALAARNPRFLTPDARAIYDRMRGSALRGKSGESAIRYAEELAWRAIRQKFALLTAAEIEEERDRALALGLMTPEIGHAEDHARNPDEGQAAEKAQEAQEAEGHGLLIPGSKAYIAAIAESRNGSWTVRTVFGSTQAAKYERRETVGIPGWPGVAVVVGFAGHGLRQPLEVRLPKTTFGAASDEEARVQAVKWVRDHTFAIWQVARNLIPPHLKHAPNASGASGRDFQWVRRSKLYLSPEKATERISWAEAYVPWEVDLQGQYATESEVERMAHGFILGKGKIGEMHGRWAMPDGEPPGRVVESFVSRWPNPYFTPGAWVLGVKWHKDVWGRIQAGEYKGLSIGGRWGAAPIRVAAVLEAEEMAA